MSFGHNAISGDLGDGMRFHMDSWGAGPFWMIVDRKRFLFEDSDMFGATVLRKSDHAPADRQPGEKHRFWIAYTMWRRSGRPMKCLGRAKVAVWKEPKPTLYWVDENGLSHFIQEGDLEDGPIRRVARPDVENET